MCHALPAHPLLYLHMVRAKHFCSIARADAVSNREFHGLTPYQDEAVGLIARTSQGSETAEDGRVARVRNGVSLRPSAKRSAEGDDTSRR